MTSDVPPGIITAHVLPPGRHYPGAEHRYWVHRRLGSGTAPLPLQLVLDGGWLFLPGGLPGLDLPAVLDDLMASGAIPEAVTVFVDPPTSPADGGGQARWERSFQYDALSSRFVDFLFEELVPAVAAEHPLTDRADERLIVGVSTGAVGAFVAAWHRPDLIGRVLTGIGTFVAMRGADTLAGIVRKSERKPLRVWLEANAGDHITPDAPWGTHYAGSWPVANRTLHEALRFAGYDSVLDLGDGEHDFGHLAERLPEALRWVWGDAASVPQEWRRVDLPAPAAGLGVRDDGRVVAQVGDVLQVLGGGRTPVGPITAFACGRGDEVYAAGADGVLRLHVGDATTDLVADFPATALLWTGDGVLHGIVADRLGTVDLAARTVTWTDLDLVRPSGLALSPDRAQLLVTDAASRHQWSFLRDAPGVPGAPEPYFRMEELDDGGAASAAATDTDGWAYFATPLGIQVCEPIGRVARILTAPEPTGRTTALAFAGHDLVALHEGRLFTRRLPATGSSATAPVTPPPPPL